MQSITVKRSEIELRTAELTSRWQRYRQPVSRDNSLQIEDGDDPVPSWCAPQDEKQANRGVEYEDDHRHWSPHSQPYASADMVIQYLRDGWLLGDKVMVQAVRCFSRRSVELYYFRLTSGREQILMPVIANPVVLRLIMERKLVTIRLYTDCETSDLS